jgi:hypothetical protein
MRIFPKTAADGSFAVRARFGVCTPDLVASVQYWLRGWLATNLEWEFFGETHRYSEYFKSEPEVKLNPCGEFLVLFNGISDDRRMWKDWMARILKEIQDRFPQIGELKDVRNADEEF